MHLPGGGGHPNVSGPCYLQEISSMKTVLRGMLVFNLACPNLLRRGDSMNRVIEEILGVISFITEAYIQQDNFPLKTHLLSQPFFEG